MAQSPSVQDDPRFLIDQTRYPFHNLDDSAGQALVNRCQADLAEQAICVLPGLIPETLRRQMVREAIAVAHLGHYYDRPRRAYVYDDPDSYPPGHPRGVTHPNRYRQVLNHHIPNDSLLRRLFLWPAMTDFVRRALGLERLYTSACPHLALTLQFAGEGDTNGWHYDPNDGVVTLLLQAPDAGGGFEYAPYIRGTGDDESAQNYPGVRALLDDPTGRAQCPRIAPGSLTLFNGSRSLHRVAPVGPTKQPRIIAIFSYDQSPDMVFSQGYIDHLRSFPQGTAA